VEELAILHQVLYGQKAEMIIRKCICSYDGHRQDLFDIFTRLEQFDMLVLMLLLYRFITQP
jgi:hypothetical protein